jgi:hypothetical protein
MASIFFFTSSRLRPGAEKPAPMLGLGIQVRLKRPGGEIRLSSGRGSSVRAAERHEVIRPGGGPDALPNVHPRHGRTKESQDVLAAQIQMKRDQPEKEDGASCETR